MDFASILSKNMLTTCYESRYAGKSGYLNPVKHWPVPTGAISEERLPHSLQNLCDGYWGTEAADRLLVFSITPDTLCVTPNAEERMSGDAVSGNPADIARMKEDKHQPWWAGWPERGLSAPITRAEKPLDDVKKFAEALTYARIKAHHQSRLSRARALRRKAIPPTMWGYNATILQRLRLIRKKRRRCWRSGKRLHHRSVGDAGTASL